VSERALPIRKEFTLLPAVAHPARPARRNRGMRPVSRVRRTGLIGRPVHPAGRLFGRPRTVDVLVPATAIAATKGIAYGPDARHRLDTYLPASATGPAPLVVFFYGGSWTRGERADYRFVGEALASSGIAAVIADYRLSPQVRWRDILADCARATRWARDQRRNSARTRGPSCS
jgi:acetyl esterase/lipase